MGSLSEGGGEGGWEGALMRVRDGRSLTEGEREEGGWEGASVRVGVRGRREEGVRVGRSLSEGEG